MWKRYLTPGIIVLVLIIAAVLLLTRGGSQKTINQPVQNTPQAAAPLQKPITTQNVDQALEQTDANIQSQLDQVDKDLQSIDQSETNVSSDNTSSINNL